MPCPHYKTMISTRSKSPPTTASAAYQSGERLYDERTHWTKNYDDKRGVIYTEIMLPDKINGEDGANFRSGFFLSAYEIRLSMGEM